MDSTPITINYVPDGDDWTITVNAGEESTTAHAPGLIAARDSADQIVEKIVTGKKQRTVVHLLDGDAFAFTTAYLHARHGMTTGQQQPPASEAEPEESASAAG
ncbi:hypothetical protein [Allokutzneria sp. NRRL B-24872]|uniref:hypothetical protein n=1 Tax=Allokutzneria sp. NRRL B-24872 TaxID=1137961 RepID=UPI001AEF80E7|nr:hypothetical protein [Allokutzneria sp. NRRL B-24872]